MHHLATALVFGRALANAYQHELEAVVMRNDALVALPLPLYVTDTYMAGWEQFDLTIHPNLDLGTEIYYAPDPSVSGNYSADCFGERAFVRRRLALMQKSGLTPAIHVRSKAIQLNPPSPLRHDLPLMQPLWYHRRLCPTD